MVIDNGRIARFTTDLVVIAGRVHLMKEEWEGREVS